MSDNERADMAQRITHSTHAIVRIVDELLDISGKESVHYIDKTDMVNCNDLARELLVPYIDIDIVMNELDTLANIDYKTRTEKPEHRTLTCVRIGTCGGLQPYTPTGCFIASVKSIGFDGLLNFYAGRNEVCDLKLEEAFKKHMDWNPLLAAPYVAQADPELIDRVAGDDMVRGYTIACGGFYGPQGRILRANIADPKQNEKVESFEYEGMKVCNFEMESSALAGLASLLGHRAMTCCMVIANRYAQEMNTNYKNSIDTLIQLVLDRI